MEKPAALPVRGYIEFIKPLLYGAQSMIFLIVDGHTAHKAESVMRFVESVKDRFWLFFVLPYSRELNRDKQVWSDVKNSAVQRKTIAFPKDLHGGAISRLRLIQKSPDRIHPWFTDERKKYGA
jgi:transposase